MARQASLFAPPPPRVRAARPAPHATSEDMARPRAIHIDLFPGAREIGWTHRPNDTPVGAMRSYLPRIGLPPQQVEPRLGANPDEVEIRAVGAVKGLNPHHLLAVITGLTFDEARKALAALS